MSIPEFTLNIYTETLHKLTLTVKSFLKGQRDGSEVKSTRRSSRGPGFNSQHPHGSSKLSVAPDPGDPIASHRHTCKQTPMHRK